MGLPAAWLKRRERMSKSGLTLSAKRSRSCPRKTRRILGMSRRTILGDALAPATVESEIGRRTHEEQMAEPAEGGGDTGREKVADQIMNTRYTRDSPTARRAQTGLTEPFHDVPDGIEVDRSVSILEITVRETGGCGWLPPRLLRHRRHDFHGIRIARHGYVGCDPGKLPLVHAKPGPDGRCHVPGPDGGAHNYRLVGGRIPDGRFYGGGSAEAGCRPGTHET
jgi:hypothetical protein